ncbi:cytochrome c biogenesis CcdA family protein [uncultured Helicobacter sp.]|uniref:cytochrome c biogenesis CcdA family protein n=2 Tax=uncultured Helicobacter sp. TaxID=175537 RepID=UPI0025F43FBB|nr:cytochrome c biogenesis protein CcdA [uncultured Helicobacter sp.]
MNLDDTLLTLYGSMPFMASLLAGILTFLSPCILPLIPPYISYISGVGISDLQHTSTAHKGKIILTSLLFIAGFSLVFITLGIFASSTLGEIFTASWLRYLAGCVIIFFGLHFLFHFKYTFLHRHIQHNFDYTRFGFLSPFVLGIGFSIGWSPCVGPILASIFTLSLANPTHAFWLMLCYTLGLGLAFFLVALFINAALRFLKKLTAFLRPIEVISGILLILIGVLIIAQKTDFLLP